MSRKMPPESLVAAAIKDLSRWDQCALEHAARSGNWIGKYDVSPQEASEMVMDAVVFAFRAWCHYSESVPYAVRPIFGKIHDRISEWRWEKCDHIGVIFPAMLAP